jgi:hypothetical protein
VNGARADLLPADPQVHPFVRTMKRRVKARKPSRLGAVLASAMTWLVGCAVTGAAVTVAGVFLLAGTGWALIAVGLFLFLVSGLIRIGITHG